MKNRNFMLKLLSLVLVLGVLAYYQDVALARSVLAEENEAAVAAAQEHNDEILRQQREMQAQNGGDIPGEAGLYHPGVYQGTGNGFGGAITVSVTVSENQIESVEVLSHDGEDPAYYDLAQAVVADILKEQTAGVDTVSGATFSSQGILDAVAQAMEQAVK